jgi:hypothetical protein
MSIPPKGVLVAMDIDGSDGMYALPRPPCPPSVCLSGRTFAEYDNTVRNVAAVMPVYIRGSGKVNDSCATVMFLVQMIKLLGITHWIESDKSRADVISSLSPDTIICRAQKLNE